MKYSDLIVECSNISAPVKNVTTSNNIEISEFLVTKELSEQLNRKVGKYITLFPTKNNTEEELVSELFKGILKLSEYYRLSLKKVLVIGLGNNRYVADELGDLVVEKIQVKENELLAFTPKISSQTGIKSSVIIKSIVKELKPDLVIVVDSIATSTKSRLANCYQLTTAGIAPGGGVNNRQSFIDTHYLSTPIIAIGFPVILSFPNEYMMPYNIEDIIQSSSSILAKAINKFF